MPVFLLESLEGSRAWLNETESFHLCRVLRGRPGDDITLVDGHGTRIQGRVVDANPKRAEIEVIEEVREYLSKPYNIHIAIAPTKSSDRFEWFLEKATEIGIDKITPLLCARSERPRIRKERIDRILLSAMKQSGRAFLPEMNEMTGFSDFLTGENPELKYIAHCNSKGLPLLSDLSPKGEDCLILVVPEGDFTPEEVSQALASGFSEISLGDAVYRTETAGLMAILTAHFILGSK